MSVIEIDRTKLYANTSEFVRFVLDPITGHPKFQMELILQRIEFMSENYAKTSKEFKHEFKSQMIELNALFAHIHRGKRARDFLAA